MIQELREAKGLTQRDLAERVGVTPGYIAQIEMGLRKNPSPDVLRRLAKGLNVPVARLNRSKEAMKMVTVKLKDGKELKYEGVSYIDDKPHRLKLHGGPGYDALAEFDKADISSWYSELEE